MGCTIVPPYLLLRIAELEDPALAEAAAAARHALLHDIPFRSARSVGVAMPVEPPPAAGLERTIFTADHTEVLPGSGGVHLNSGIPNHAFYLVAAALGGFAWERAGRIWYDTITAGVVAADAEFAAFSQATNDCASDRFGAGSAEHRAVTQAWEAVGVTV